MKKEASFTGRVVGFILILVFVVTWQLESISARAATGGELTGDRVQTEQGELIIHPVDHATFLMSWNGKVIYVDPVGGAKGFTQFPRPDLVLVSDIHGDHLDPNTLAGVVTEKTTIVAPSAVANKLPKLKTQTTVLPNGETKTVAGVQIEAIPMYNLTPDRLKYHSKGRGNGYVLTMGGKRIYISGDTEDIPEMRALKNIDVAFVCMNLPYTMEVEKAASAVQEFKPKVVYPYHYRGSDVEKFKELVSKTPGIEVRLREWYPKKGSSK